MLRRARTIGILLTLGAATSLAVALALNLSIRSFPVADTGSLPHSAGKRWSRLASTRTDWIMYFEHDEFGVTQVESLAITSNRDLPDSGSDLTARAPRWAAPFVWPWFNGHAPWPPANGVDWRVVTAFGWPFRCVWMSHEPTSQTFAAPIQTSGGWNIPAQRVTPPSRFPRAVAYRVLPHGLVKNTVIYAINWGVLVALLIRARAAVRRRHNLCPHCRYDLRATPPASPCPECGRPRTANPSHRVQPD
jgi:hypothetical protein